MHSSKVTSGTYRSLLEGYPVAYFFFFLNKGNPYGKSQCFDIPDDT